VAFEATPTTQSYWDTAAKTYDDDFVGTLIGQTRREAVWRVLDGMFHAGQHVLELNCGTGVDAVHLAERGIRVLACDIAPGMIDLARMRANASGFARATDFRVLPTESIGQLEAAGPFDGAFSNFAGLNCVEDLSSTARTLYRLLKPGARVLICMLGKFVPWEILWFLAKGNPRRAVQRLGSGTIRDVEGGVLKVRYYRFNEIVRMFAPGFQLRGWRGLGITVPPSYVESLARRVPGITRSLAALDDRLGGVPIIRRMADSVLMEFQRGESVQLA
jgi:ubiquinone/menaquinone biosynthesis C-methylase UbiE